MRAAGEEHFARAGAQGASVRGRLTMISPDFWLKVGGNLEITPRRVSKRRLEREIAFYHEVNLVLSDLLAPYRYINSMSSAEIKRMLQQILEVINAITEQYLGREDDGRSPAVNSCYMTPILRQDFTDDILAQTKFVDHGRDLRSELRAVLQLVQWAKPMGHLPTVLYLPVHDKAAPVFGAPWAYDRRVPHFVDDTMRPTRRRYALRWWVDKGPAAPGRLFLPEDLPAAIVDELRSYFREHEHHMRSFVSIPLPIPPEDAESYPSGYAREPLAILNIQSDQPRLLGSGGARARTLLAALVPVFHVLIRYVSRVRLDHMASRDANPVQ